MQIDSKDQGINLLTMQIAPLKKLPARGNKRANIRAIQGG
jgi:hypothetical protein